MLFVFLGSPDEASSYEDDSQPPPELRPLQEDGSVQTSQSNTGDHHLNIPPEKGTHTREGKPEMQKERLSIVQKGEKIYILPGY